MSRHVPLERRRCSSDMSCAAVWLDWLRTNEFLEHGLSGEYTVYPRRAAMLVLAATPSIPVRQARYTRQQFSCNFVFCNVRTSA
jgi:hypothetical protein